MDDKEYYSIKRISTVSVEQLQRRLKKLDKTKYRENQVHQGHDDAEMLLEKQCGFDSTDSEE